MNLIAGSNLSGYMRTIFWARANPFNAWTNYQRHTFLLAASKAQVLQRELVQKSLHQVHEHNHESIGAFVKPTIDLYRAEKNWNRLTAGLGEEEIADLEAARAQLTNYARLYDIFEYASDLNSIINTLETRIYANNASLAFNAYRFSSSSRIETIFPEIEQVL